MKKIIIAIALMFGSVSFLHAQAPTTVTKESKKAKKEKTTSVQNNGLKKDGTPDMRLKANKTKVKANTSIQTVPVQPAPNVQTQVTTQKRTRRQVQPRVQPQVTQQRTQVSTSTTKRVDQAIGTDAKGRTIYQGPRGGKYYINKNGNKEYVK